MFDMAHTDNRDYLLPGYMGFTLRIRQGHVKLAEGCLA